MSQTLHQIYQSKAIVVTRTMVIKFHKIAEAINRTVIADGYEVDETDPTTWKYYLNMFGEYHESDRARLLTLSGGLHDSIRIKVAGEYAPKEIDFDKPSISGLKGDVAVANEYRFNTFYFNELVSTYPEFEDLILGILNPIPLDMSTTAREGEILYCGGYVKTKLATGYTHYVRQDYGIITDNYLIESNEENAVHILQDHIYNYLERWWNAGYGVTSNLFLTTFIGMLYLSVPQILGNIRIGNAKTPFAHSFHIREHLESNGGLGWVTEYLSKGVLLWLYRNAVWLNANRGKQDVLDKIIDNVLTPSNIPISAHRLRHDVEEMDVDVLTSDPFMEQYKLNFATNAQPTRVEIIDIIDAEVKLATDNYYDQPGQVDEVTNASRYSMYDNLNTKVLESRVVDTSNKVPVTLEDIALNLWLFTASRGDYTGTVIFTNPITNERIQMTPLNAYIFSFYCLNRGWANYHFEDIPTMYARLIHRHPTITPGDPHPVKPKVADVSRGVIKPFITDAEMTGIIGEYIPQYKHNSTTTFGREVMTAHAESLRKYDQYTRIDDAQGRGFGEWVAHKCYWYDVACPLVKQPMKYNDWLVLQGMEVSDYSRQEFVDLGLAIVEAAVGVNLSRSEELRNRQSAVLAILKHFASYTIQIIQKTVASDSYWLDWKHTRLTNLKSRMKGKIEAQLPLYTVKDHWSISEGPIHLDLYTSAHYEVVLETLKSHQNAYESNVTVTRIREVDSARYKIPLFSIVDMKIPDVDTGADREYEWLTSTQYPFGGGDSMSSKARIKGKIHITSARIIERDTLRHVAKLSGIKLTTPNLDIADRLTQRSRIHGPIVINPPQQTVVDTLKHNARIHGNIHLNSPMISGEEMMTASGRISSIHLLLPRVGEADIITTNARIGSTIYVQQPRAGSPEQLEYSARIQYVKTHYNRYGLTDSMINAGMVVSIRLHYPQLAISDSMITQARLTSITLKAPTNNGAEE